MSKYQVYLEPLIRFGSLGHRLYIRRQDRYGEPGAVMQGNFTLRTVKEHEFVPPEDTFLDDSRGPDYADVRAFLQAMSDAAWEIGIKPKQLEDNSNELKATKYHLEDMRKLTIK